MRSEKIKVGFCVAYDWPMLRNALPLVYDSADRICLSIDKERIGWGHEPFAFDDDAFRALINSIDVNKKVVLLEEDFHRADLTPMQNETLQRSRMAEFMGAGGWHIQLDCDEYFTSFDAFVSYLVSLPQRRTRKLNISCALLTLFKKTQSGFLFIPPTEKSIEFIQIATREPYYVFGRRNGNFNHLTNFIVLHQSWARSEREIEQKLANWGHKLDFDTKRFFESWKSLTPSNYNEFKNFHPISPSLWSSLDLIEAKDEDELIKNPPVVAFPYSSSGLAWMNNRNVSRIKGLLRKLFH